MKDCVTVSTKKDFEDAVNDNIGKIIVTGRLAQNIIAAQKKKSRTKKIGILSAVLAGLAGFAGVVMAPVTGGASLAATAVCSKVAVTTGTVSVAAGTIDIVIGVLGVLGAMKIAGNILNTIKENYDVKISAGSTSVEFTRK